MVHSFGSGRMGRDSAGNPALSRQKFKYCALELGLSQDLHRLVAEPPVVAFVGLHALFCAFHVCRRGNNNVIADKAVSGPVGRNGAAVGVGSLQGFQNAQDFIHVAAHFLGVVHNEAHNALGVDDKDRADCVGALALVDHAEFFGNIAAIVGNDRELDVHIEFFLDPFQPLDVGEDLVDGKADEHAVQFLEACVALLEGAELGCAHRGEVCRMAEENEPLA